MIHKIHIVNAQIRNAHLSKFLYKYSFNYYPHQNLKHFQQPKCFLMPILSQCPPFSLLVPGASPLYTVSSDLHLGFEKKFAILSKKLGVFSWKFFTYST